jgi:integrase/recombinase XerC
LPENFQVSHLKPKPPGGNVMTETFLQYLRYEKRYSPHTLSAYESDLLQFRDFLAVTYELNDLSQADFSLIRSWMVSLVEQKTGASSINRKLATLRTFYKFLQKQGTVSVNPMLKVKSLKAAKTLPHFIPETEINTFLNEFSFPEGFPGLRDKLVLELLYSTGIRLSELVALQESDWNLSENILKIQGKRNKERLVPVGKMLTDRILQYLKEKKQMLPAASRTLMVTNKGLPVYAAFVYRLVRRYLGLANVAGQKSPHILRHTFATHLLDHGADLNAIKDLLGHSSLAATQVYTHNSLEKLRKVFEQAHPKA